MIAQASDGVSVAGESATALLLIEALDAGLENDVNVAKVTGRSIGAWSGRVVS